MWDVVSEAEAANQSLRLSPDTLRMGEQKVGKKLVFDDIIKPPN